MGILQNVDQEQRKSLLLVGLIGTAVVVVLLLFFILIGGSNKNKDVSTGGEKTGTPKATIVNGKQLFAALQGSARYNELANELAAVGRTQYKMEKNPTFTISYPNTNTPLHITGSYNDKAQTRFDLQITSLENDRMSIVAKDLGTNKDISSYFAANSAANKFIASLPINSGNFSVSYAPGDQSLVVSLYDAEPAHLEEAKTYLKQQLVSKDLSGYTIGYTYPPTLANDDTGANTGIGAPGE